jgi:hypothetical protein
VRYFVEHYRLCGMSDAKGSIGAVDEWYLYLHFEDEVVQPYRSAPTVWPISAEEVKQIEAQAIPSNPSAINNLGTYLTADACERSA